MKEYRSVDWRTKAVRIADVAVAAGVSVMTVSRVIAGGRAVRRETRERVDAAMKALRYSPGRSATGSVAGRNIEILLLHAGMGSSHLDEFLVGAFEASRRSRIRFVAQEYDHDWRQKMACDEPVARRFDGIVVAPSLCDLSSVQGAVGSLGIPAVAVAPEYATGWEMSVRIDSYRAAYEMTRHLGALGHRRIGLVTGMAEDAGSTSRLAGYGDALSDLGLPASPELITSGLSTYRSGLDAAERLLDLPSPPSAIFALDDEMATAVVAVAHRRALDVPSDLTVCGFNDSALSARLWPALTTIRQPVPEMAARSVELLAEAIALRRLGRSDELTERHLLFPYSLIRRQSDAAPRMRPAMVQRRAATQDQNRTGSSKAPALHTR